MVRGNALGSDCSARDLCGRNGLTGEARIPWLLLMSDGAWLTKSEVNSFYYNTVGGEIVFVTEARAGFHPGAVANLVSHHSATLGKRAIRVLEIGANDCAFARVLLNRLRRLIDAEASGLERIDYLAVEYARASLEAAADAEEQNGIEYQVRRGPPVPPLNGPPPKAALVALLTDEGPPAVNLGLIHADANQFVRSTSERFDFVILNELLDDMPCRAYYAGDGGRRFEAVSHARPDNGGWRVRVRPQEFGPDALGDITLAEMPPGSITARSGEGVELVSGIAELLVPGGMLLLHDYGFADPFMSLEHYAGLQPSLPAYVAMEFPRGSETGFPRSFFRVFGNDRHKVVQVTNDVNFAELAAALERRGAVTTIAHGSMILNQGGTLKKGDGVFLSEFGLLEPGDDLPTLLDDLHANQVELRADFVREHMAGRGSVFMDIVFVRSSEQRGT